MWRHTSTRSPGYLSAGMPLDRALATPGNRGSYERSSRMTDPWFAALAAGDDDPSMRPASMIGLIVGAALFLAACGGKENAAPSGTTTDPSTMTVTSTAAVDTPTTEQETTVAEPDESPGEFFERFLGYELKGQYGRSWDVLHPGHQSVVSRERYEDCRSERFDRFGSVSGELVSFDVVEVYDDPIDAAEIPEKQSTVVTMEFTVRAGDERQTFTDTAHAIEVADHWVWVLAPGDVRDYKAGACPT